MGSRLAGGASLLTEGLGALACCVIALIVILRRVQSALKIRQACPLPQHPQELMKSSIRNCLFQLIRPDSDKASRHVFTRHLINLMTSR